MNDETLKARVRMHIEKVYLKNFLVLMWCLPLSQYLPTIKSHPKVVWVRQWRYASQQPTSNFCRYLWRNFPRVFTLDKLTNGAAPILTLPCQSRSRILCDKTGPVMSDIGRMLPYDPGRLLPTFQIVKSFEKKYICKVKDSIKFI